MEVNTGTFVFLRGGTSTGQFTVAGGATLSLAGGFHDLRPTSSINGEGTVSFGTSAFGTSATVSGTYLVTGSTLVINALARFDNPVTFSSLTISSGILLVSGDVSVRGPLIWTGGTMSGFGRTRAEAGLVISGSTAKALEFGRILDNVANATWSGTGALSFYADGTLNNLTSATIDMQSDARLIYRSDTGGAGGPLNNAGTFLKSGGSGAATIEVRFNNTGTVRLQTGTLDLIGGGISIGSFTLEAGTTLGLGASHLLGSTSGITGAGSVNLSAGSFQGTVTISGTYDITGNTVVTGGTHVFMNDVTFPALTISAGAISGFGEMTVTTVLTWTGGTLGGQGRTRVNGDLNISGSSVKSLDGRTLEIPLTATWTGSGNVNANNGAVFNILPGAIFRVQTDAALGTAGPLSTFINEGTVVKETASGTANVNATFHNAGTVDVQVGGLALLGGGTHSGNFRVSAGTTLAFGGSGRNHVLSATARVIGAGAVSFVAGFATGGSTAIGGVYEIGGATSVIGGGVVSFLNPVTLSSLTLNGTLTGPGDVTVTGPLTWTGGFMTGLGRTRANGGIIATGNSQWTLDGRTLDNAGTATWSATGTFAAINGAVINNLAGATFNMQLDGFLGPAFAVVPTATFNNAGSLIKPGATTTVIMVFNNAGTVDVRAGTLSLNGGGTSSGSFIVAAGANLGFGSNPTGGAHNLGPTTSISGAGTVTFNAGNTNLGGAYGVTGPTRIVLGTASFSNNVTFPSLTLDRGTLTGTGDVTVTGLITWTGGTISGAGRVHANGGISASGFDLMRLEGKILDNVATATWTGSAIFEAGNGAVFNNLAGASFIVQADRVFRNRPIGPPPIFNNAGTVVKQAGSGTTSFQAIAFHNSGIVTVQTGTLSLAGGGNHVGSFQVAMSATLAFGLGGAGIHNLTSTSSLSGVGTVSFAGGEISVNGDYQVTGTLVNGGNVSFFNSVTLSSLTVSNGVLSGPGDVTVAGPLLWTGGAMSGPGRTVANGGLTLSGGGGKTLNDRTLENAGNALWTGAGSIFVFNAAVIQNRAGALFEVQGDALVQGQNSVSPPTFNNLGIFRKTSGTGLTSFLGVAFHNQGTIDVQSGRLELSGGGNHVGNFIVADGATLGFGGGGRAHTLSGTSRVSGAGTVAFISGFIGGGGSSTVVGTYEITGTTLVNGGTANFLGPVTLASLSVTGGTFAAFSNVSIGGLFTWIGGTITGTGRVRANGGLLITGSIGNRVLDGVTLDNVTTATVSTSGVGGTLIGGGATLNNLEGAVFTVEGQSSFSGGGVPSFFNNAGTLRKVGGSGALVFGAMFSNTGTVELINGTLIAFRGGNHSGTFTVAEGATLTFGGNTGDSLQRVYNFSPSSVITSAGNVNFSPAGGPFATFNIAGTFEVAGATSFGGAVNFATTGRTGALNGFGQPLNITGSLTVAGAAALSGMLTGTGDLTVEGLLNWTSGTMTGTGRTIARGGIAIDGGSSPTTIDTRTLINGGTSTWVGLGALALGNGATIENLAGAVFEIRNNSPITSFGSPALFLNGGTLRKAIGSGVTAIASQFANTGTVEIQTGILNLTGLFTNFSAATTTLAGGTYQITGTLQFANANIATNAANIILNGPTSQIVNQTGVNALANFATNTAAASFTVQNGRTLSTAANFTNEGSLTVAAGSNFTTSRGFTQPSGTTTLVGGSLTAADGVVLLGGTLSGTGVINASVTNAARIDVGGETAVGVLMITGDYLQTAEGTLALELAGTEPGIQHDQLRIGGTAILDGILAVALLDEFTPQVGDAFRILTFAAREGDFAVRTGLDLGGGLFLDPIVDDTTLTLLTAATP